MKHSMHPSVAIERENHPEHLSGQQSRFGDMPGPGHVEDPRDTRKYGAELRPTGTPKAEADAIKEARIGGEDDEQALGTLLVLHDLARAIKGMRDHAARRIPWRVTVTASGLLAVNRPQVLLQTLVNNTATQVLIGLGDDMPGNSAQPTVEIQIPAYTAVTLNNGIPFPQRLSVNVLTGTAPFNVLLAGETY
jgi:hypothetical protein